MTRILSILFVFVFLASWTISAAKYDRILQEMNAIINANPNYVQLIDIGQNDQGNTIYGMKIENVAYEGKEDKLIQLLIAVLHGNEPASADLCIEFTQSVIDVLNDPTNPIYKAITRSCFYVIPVLNISGFNANRKTELDQYGNYVDPNRDYPDACVNNTYYRLASVQNLVNFMERYQVVGSVSVHGCDIGTFTYPWGIYTDNPRTDDDDFYRTVAENAVKANNYRTGTHTEVIYPAVGSYEDWAYHKHGIWTMLLQMSRYANLKNDSQALLIFFAQIPEQVSNQHEHNGNCTKTRGEDVKGRP